MTIDFDRIIDRTSTSTLKYDVRKARFGREDVLPLWVADMDFAAPHQVTQALVDRAEHPIYGYTLYPASLYEAMQQWFQRRHNWSISRKAILMCPGVVPSLHAAIIALTQAGEGVIVQPPVYPPFFAAVTETQRRLLLNPLKLVDDCYRFDLENLEQCALSGAKLLLLCSPHNPVGRVWNKPELEAVLDIARRHDITIISDEIHADLIYPDHRHIPLATLADDVSVVTAVSPSKTFNIPGLGLSSLVVNNADQRQAINAVFENWHIHVTNPFSIVAFETAYREGDEWLEMLMKYLDETKQWLKQFIEQHLSQIKLIDSEGSYLLWLDCRNMHLTDDELMVFFSNKAKVGLNPGNSFGEVGSGFMRMNIASPRSVIMQALENIKSACDEA